MAEITVYGEPQGKQRARTVRVNGNVMSFTPTETREYEKKVRACYQIAKQEHFGNKPIKAFITAFYPIPNSNSKRVKEQKLQLEILPCIKPDVDNIAKIILDSLNGVAYEDDKQVVLLTVGKLYSDNPRVVVKLEEMDYGNY